MPPAGSMLLHPLCLRRLSEGPPAAKGRRPLEPRYRCAKLGELRTLDLCLWNQSSYWFT
jgi:hypothetical protein